MIEISAIKRPASRVDRVTPEEVEILHLLLTKYSKKSSAYIQDMDEDIKSAPEQYPRLNQMDVRQRRWWIGHVLIQTGAEKKSLRGKCWSLKHG